ncbi:flagellar assembly protein FliW [Bacillus sp. JJ664]
MNIQSKYHGEIEIQQEDVITFPKGIPAFENENEFTVLPLQEGTPFSILQSVHSTNLAFIIGEVFSIFPDYDIELSQNAIETLELDDAKNAVVYCIMTVKEPFIESTANLKAPIIINSIKKIGKQVVLNQSNYETKHRLEKSPAFIQEG